MRYTADFLIAKRKEKWESNPDINLDQKFRIAVSKEIVSNPDLLKEVRAYPEKLIELVFVVVDKTQKTKPFFLNEVQQDFVQRLNQAKKDFAEGKITEISLLVLKGRQQGFTTFVTAYQLSCSILNKNFQGYTLADKSGNVEAIFQSKAKFPYSQLPDILKPTEKYNNRKQLLFELINSSWSVETATENVGRSKTVNFFHGSECAIWKCGMSSVQAALGEALTKNCIKIYESTANGYNDFERMWRSGVHINCFYEWWRTSEYRFSFGNDEIKADFLRMLEIGKDWIHDRLRWLKNEKQLSLEQIYWYWKKYEGFIDHNLIKQEFPCTPEEAFLLSGKPGFDTEAIDAQIARVVKPIKTGQFEYDYDGLKITNIHWVNDKNGCIKIHALPNQPEFTEYCIGGDTAGDGSDYYIGQVLDAKTGKQVAVLRHQFDPDQYVRQIYCLGMYYNTALLGIETNFDTYPVKELQRLGYPNQYVREVFDTFTNKHEKRFGFKTDQLTRPTIISQLKAIVRDHCDTIVDRETLEELRTIIKNAKGRIEAPVGGHDDLMIALAIGHQIKGQVVFRDRPINMPQQTHFNSEKNKQDNFRGGKITVI